MSRTVSFRASEELDEYLEQLAEERMTTKSTVAQMLVAERVRQLQSGESETELGGGDVSRGKEESQAAEPETDVFDRHPDKWYQPNSQKHDYAVAVPDDADVHDAGKTRYYKTRDGAAEGLRRWYE